MTLDTRARRAARGIRRAVEVMEMSTSTKEPRKIERFDRFRDRKQRNRRIGAFLVAATFAIATIVVGTKAFERGDRKVPETPSTQNGRIVFGEEGQNGTHLHLFTMNPDGTDVRDISVDSDSDCMSWALDGSKILIQSDGGFATINPDGTGYETLPPHQQAMGCGAISPDGTRFIMDHGKGMYTARASDGGDRVRLSNFRGLYASYSPDGTQVVFTPEHNRAATLSHHASGLWVVNTDGTGLHLVAHRYSIRPTWSPDGRRILFEFTGTAFYIVHPDGTGLRRITLESVPGLRHAAYPSWSPDGTRFVFVGGSRFGSNIFTARTDGTDVEQITHTHGIYYRSPDWGTNSATNQR
jgi:Tol biopolymer transport system component